MPAGGRLGEDTRIVLSSGPIRLEVDPSLIPSASGSGSRPPQLRFRVVNEDRQKVRNLQLRAEVPLPGNLLQPADQIGRSPSIPGGQSAAILFDACAAPEGEGTLTLVLMYSTATDGRAFEVRIPPLRFRVEGKEPRGGGAVRLRWSGASGLELRSGPDEASGWRMVPLEPEGEATPAGAGVSEVQDVRPRVEGGAPRGQTGGEVRSGSAAARPGSGAGLGAASRGSPEPVDVGECETLTSLPPWMRPNRSGGRSSARVASPGERDAMDAERTFTGPVEDLRSAKDIPADTLVGGRYRILEKIGGGGIGAVYRAIDINLGILVALKFPVAGKACDTRLVNRLQQEAMSLALVRNPHIVLVREFQRESRYGPFIVMDFIAGRTLRQRIQGSGTLDVAVALRVVREIGRALEDVHARSLVHRDIKPSNILLEEGTQKAYLLDFGLASAIEEASGGGGTRGYWPPEQRRGESATPRSDIFALARTYYVAVTGELDEDSFDLSCLPGRHQEVVRKALRRFPAERHASVTEFVAALEAASSEHAPRDEPRPPPPPPPPPPKDYIACGSCGEVNPRKLTACRVCGAAFLEDCPKCGTPQRREVVRCTKCDADLARHRTREQWRRRTEERRRDCLWDSLLASLREGIEKGFAGPEEVDEAHRLGKFLEQRKCLARDLEGADLTRPDERRVFRDRLHALLEHLPGDRELHTLLRDIEDADEGERIETALLKAQNAADKGDLSEAARLLQTVLSLDPANAPALRSRYHLQERRDLARREAGHARQALEGRALGEARNRCDDALAQDAECDEALEVLSKLNAIEAGLGETRSEAQAAFRDGDLEACRTHCEKLLDWEPTDAEAQTLLTDAQRRMEEARRLAEEALREPELEMAESRLRSALEKWPKLAEARASLTEVRALLQRRREMEETVREHMARGRLAEAVAALRAAGGSLRDAWTEERLAECEAALASAASWRERRTQVRTRSALGPIVTEGRRLVEQELLRGALLPEVEELARRRDRVEHLWERTHEARGAGEFLRVRDLLEELTSYIPEDDEVREVLRQVEGAARAERVERDCASCEALLRGGDVEAAAEEVDRLCRIYGDHPRVAHLARRIRRRTALRGVARRAGRAATILLVLSLAAGAAVAGIRWRDAGVISEALQGYDECTPEGVARAEDLLATLWWPALQGEACEVLARNVRQTRWQEVLAIPNSSEAIAVSGDGHFIGYFDTAEESIKVVNANGDVLQTLRCSDHPVALAFLALGHGLAILHEGGDLGLWAFGDEEKTRQRVPNAGGATLLADLEGDLLAWAGRGQTRFWKVVRAGMSPSGFEPAPVPEGLSHGSCLLGPRLGAPGILALSRDSGEVWCVGGADGSPELRAAVDPGVARAAQVLMPDRGGESVLLGLSMDRFVQVPFSRSAPAKPEDWSVVKALRGGWMEDGSGLAVCVCRDGLKIVDVPRRRVRCEWSVAQGAGITVVRIASGRRCLIFHSGGRLAAWYGQGS